MRLDYGDDLLVTTPEDAVNIVAFNRGNRSMLQLAANTRTIIKAQLRNGNRETAEAMRKAYMVQVWYPNLRYIAERSSYKAILKSLYTLEILDQCAIPNLTRLSGGGFPYYTVKARVARYNSKRNKKPPVK